MVTAFTEIGDPRAGGRKKDESALRWRKMRAYYCLLYTSPANAVIR